MTTYTMAPLLDALQTSDTADTGGSTLNGVLSETLDVSTVSDVIKQVFNVLSETVNVQPAILGGLQFTIPALSEGLVFSDGTTVSKLALLVLSESVSLTPTVTANAVLGLLAAEHAAFTAILALTSTGAGGVSTTDSYVVWVSNSDTFAHSQYHGFNFNSACRLGDHYYGAGITDEGDGIHLLEGDKDGQTEIQYYITLPTSEFGTSRVKRIPKVYMGFSQDGDMRLRVITHDGVDRVYAFNRTSDGYSDNGSAVGRGVKSRYFTFDLYNGKGQDLEMEYIEFFPVLTSRLMTP